MATKALSENQCLQLHQHYPPPNCCICNGRSRIEELEAEIDRLREENARLHEGDKAHAECVRNYLVLEEDHAKLRDKYSTLEAAARGTLVLDTNQMRQIANEDTDPPSFNCKISRVAMIEFADAIDKIREALEEKP